MTRRSFTLITTRKCDDGFEVLNAGYPVAKFTGPDAEERTQEYGESYVSDLRYEAEGAEWS